MSYADGWAAINLEMPERIPRTEYSAEFHWPLISKVTGIPVNGQSDAALRAKASAAFIKAWNYGFIWSILIHNQVFGDKCTKMGHADYMEGGVDFDNQVRQLYDDPEEALKFDPWELYGARDEKTLIRDFNNDYMARCGQNPDAVNMTGVYVTCMSGLIEVFGWEILLSMAGLEPKAFGDLTNRYVSWIAQYFEALAKCAAPVVMIHDDIVWTSGAFFHPEWYRNFLFPAYRKLFAPLIQSGKKIMYTSDGNYTEFIDDIADCGIHGFVMEPTTDMAYIAENYGKTHVIIGNADTRALKLGKKEDIYAEVKRCVDIGKKCPGYFMAVGNHIPPDTPVENALYYNEAYEKLARR
ncbi:MAG: uroporphyrinogen decarboxylase family protein [Defluviitaleaceae bacterium]|nr:uroporphyrinogen decarboxylase family protein [Defluviitaleaceae bacterium]